jgi:hypothetical protein
MDWEKPVREYIPDSGRMTPSQPTASRARTGTTMGSSIFLTATLRGSAGSSRPTSDNSTGADPPVVRIPRRRARSDETCPAENFVPLQRRRFRRFCKEQAIYTALPDQAEKGRLLSSSGYDHGVQRPGGDAGPDVLAEGDRSKFLILSPSQFGPRTTSAVGVLARLADQKTLAALPPWNLKLAPHSYQLRRLTIRGASHAFT